MLYAESEDCQKTKEDECQKIYKSDEYDYQDMFQLHSYNKNKGGKAVKVVLNLVSSINKPHAIKTLKKTHFIFTQ